MSYLLAGYVVVSAARGQWASRYPPGATRNAARVAGGALAVAVFGTSAPSSGLGAHCVIEAVGTQESMMQAKRRAIKTLLRP